MEYVVKGTVHQHAWRVTAISILGDVHWSVKFHHDRLGWTVPATYSGMVSGDEVHTERLEEVLSYIANEVGATGPSVA